MSESVEHAAKMPFKVRERAAGRNACSVDNSTPRFSSPPAFGNTAIPILPFLDILFAAIGVFLILLAVEWVTCAEETRQVATDFAVVCQGEDRIRWADRGGNDRRLERRDFGSLLAEATANWPRIPAMTIAVGLEGADTCRRLRKQLGAMEKKGNLPAWAPWTSSGSHWLTRI